MTIEQLQRDIELAIADAYSQIHKEIEAEHEQILMLIK